MYFFIRRLRNAIVAISPILIFSGCSGNNPVNQLVELIKNELIPIVDKGCNCDDKTDEPVVTNDFSGCWIIKQSTGVSGTIRLTQSDCIISGITDWDNQKNGKITGTVKGSTINFTVAYPDGDTVTYSAILNDDAASVTGGKARSSDGSTFLWDAVKSTCEPKTVDGCWAVDQNNGHIGMLTFKQNGTAVTGKSGWTTHSNGPIEGTVIGDKISFTITYPENVIGYYEATICNDGTALINGITKSSTGDQAMWNAAKTVCVEQPGCNHLSKDQYTLALYYFDETDGITLLDQTGKASGRMTGGTRVPGKCGNALQFKPGEYATFDTILPNNLPEGTIELSVKFDSDFDPTKLYSIFGNDGSRIQIIYKSGYIIFSKNHSNQFIYTQTKFNFISEKWFNIAVTWGSKGMRIFIDGHLVSSNTDYSTYQASPRTTFENIFYIGKKSWCCMEGLGISTDLSFKGSIDEIRVSSVARY